MTLSPREQKIQRRSNSRSLVLWKKILPPQKTAHTASSAAWTKLHISLGHFTRGLEAVGTMVMDRTQIILLYLLGASAVLFFVVPLLYPQSRFVGLELEMPQDPTHTHLHFGFGALEEDERELPQDQIKHTLPKPLETSSYRVKSGEALSTIANKFGLSLGTLISFNNISNVKRLGAGTVLTVPNQNGLQHVVARGESLGSIANKTGISYETLLDANNMDSPVIRPGQKLFLPGAVLARNDLRRALGNMFIMPASGRFTSGYGTRRDPFTGLRRFHNGIDIANQSGTPIKAAREGRVVDVGYHSSYGNYVVLGHDGGYQTMYAHLLSYSVKKGQPVGQGATIAQMGNTGYSTGTHLHFSVFLRNQPVNPTRLLY